VSVPQENVVLGTGNARKRHKRFGNIVREDDGGSSDGYEERKIMENDVLTTNARSISEYMPEEEWK